MFYLPILKKYDNECKSWRLHVLCAIFPSKHTIVQPGGSFLSFLVDYDIRISYNLFIYFIYWVFFLFLDVRYLGSIVRLFPSPHRSQSLNYHMFLQGPLLDADKVEGIAKCNWYLPFANEEDTKVRLLVASQSSPSAQHLGKYWKLNYIKDSGRGGTHTRTKLKQRASFFPCTFTLSPFY